MLSLALVLHLLAATIWTGGHLILALVILPAALKQKDIETIQQFESSFEKIGIPALLLQILTGLYMSYQYLPDINVWFSLDNDVSKLITLKLSLLAATALLAVDARLRIIPNLNQNNLVALAYHIIPVTIISVLFVILGLSLRINLF